MWPWDNSTGVGSELSQGDLINPKLSRKRAPSRGEMVTKAQAVAVQPMTP